MNLRLQTIVALARKMPDRFRQLLISVLVGVVSGLGAIVFDLLLKFCLQYFIYLPTGYVEPGIGGAGPGSAPYGSGGSGGKEGPIAQTGAGFGSFLGSVLKLSPGNRRTLVLAGAAAGIGAIFRAPLGAALYAPEVLYREMEFESKAILPCILSSIVAYAIFGLLYVPGPLFFPGPVDFDFAEMLPYLVFGVACALAGFCYIKIFYGLRDFFRRLPLPRMLKPALGGLLLGGIIYFYPQVSSTGYGWVQMALSGQLLWKTMLILAFLKIAATSCTIGSGGSGGVFGPSVFIGAMLGGAFGYLGHQLAPAWVIHPNSFVLVGIGGFFAGVAKVPMASIIMACEMSNSYSLLVPLMLVSSVSYVLLGKTSLYEKQVLTAIASPAHVGEFARGLLKGMSVSEALTQRPATVIPEDLPFSRLVKIVLKSGANCFPVVNAQGRMTGIISAHDIREAIFDKKSHSLVAKDLAKPGIVPVFWDDTLEDALDKMLVLQMDELPVVRAASPDQVASIISKEDILNCYHSVCELKI